MLASRITEQSLRTAAASVGVAIDIKTLNTKGTRHRVKVNSLVPAEARTPAGNRRRGEKGNAPYQRISASTFSSGRRVHAVCWHGFRDFFRAAFALEPDAVFSTSMDTWRGSADFEARFASSGHRNIGSQMCPMSACEACECPDSGRAS